jgi:hypothetical protein
LVWGLWIITSASTTGFTKRTKKCERIACSGNSYAQNSKTNLTFWKNCWIANKKGYIIHTYIHTYQTQKHNN